MSIQFKIDSSTSTPPLTDGSAIRTTETASISEITTAIAIPALRSAMATASEAIAISPSRAQPVSLKFQMLSRTLVRLGYSQFNTSPCLRAVLKIILIQLADVTNNEVTKRSLHEFSKKIGKRTDNQPVTDAAIASAIEKLVTTPEIVSHFDCSCIHYGQREQIKTNLLKGAELLCQLFSYWNLSIEIALKSYLPAEDSLKVTACLLRERGMLYGYVTNLAGKIAQELSLFTARNSHATHDYNLILKLIIDVLTDHPDIALHQSSLSASVAVPIKTLLEPYHASKKIKDRSHILGPSIDIAFYANLIDGPTRKILHLETQGHIPTLLNAFLLKCAQFHEKLDALKLQLLVNKARIAKENAESAVAADQELKKLKRKALQSELSKQLKKIDKLASGLDLATEQASTLKHTMKRLEEHLNANTSVNDYYIKKAICLINSYEKDTIEIYNLITSEVNRNLISHEALSDRDITVQNNTPRMSLKSFHLLPTPTMNHEANPPDRLPSLEKKIEYRRLILEGKDDSCSRTILETLERNIGVLNTIRTEAESVIHICKELDYIFECEQGKIEEDLARDTAAYNERFDSLTDELDPPDTKLPLLFSTAERTFVPTPPRTSSATDSRTITPSPPLMPSYGALSPSPTLRGLTPLERLLAESPPPPTCARALSYEHLHDEVDFPPQYGMELTAHANSITSKLKHMVMLRSSMLGKGSTITEESTSHLILAGQDMEMLIKAIQNKDLSLFRTSASLLMIDTHIAIEQYLKGRLAGSIADLTNHSLVSLESMLKGDISTEFHQLLEESDLSIIWARYPEKALQTHSHKRRKPPLIECIKLLSSLEGLETQEDQASLDKILSQLQGTLIQTASLLLGPDEDSSIESVLATTLASPISPLPRKQNELDRAIQTVRDTVNELCARTDLNAPSLTSLKEITHYLNWIEAAENTLQSDPHKSSSYWIMRLFIGGVDKLFENLYIAAAAAHGHGEIRSHNILSLRKLLFNGSIKSTLFQEEIAHIAGFNIGNGLQYPHQQKGARSAILLKALNYSLSHIGVEEGFTPTRAEMMSDWSHTLGTQVQLALLIWLKEVRSLFPSRADTGGPAATGEDSSR